MEDKGKMDEVIEQMKLMNVLLSKRDKREETKENYTNWVVKRGASFFLFLWFLVFLLNSVNFVLTPTNEVNKSHTPPMNDPEIGRYIPPRDVGGG